MPDNVAVAHLKFLMWQMHPLQHCEHPQVPYYNKIYKRLKASVVPFDEISFVYPPTFFLSNQNQHLLLKILLRARGCQSGWNYIRPNRMNREIVLTLVQPV